jgi:hypothetical protein
VLIAAVIAAVQCQCAREAARAGFWFSDVTFELPARETTRIGGALRDDERRHIEQVAWAELTSAYAQFRIAFADDRSAYYRVAVVQDLPPIPSGARTNLHGSAGASIVLGPFPRQGAVSFLVLAKNAVYYAPPDADRATIIDAIGRGIGRAAAHEFAHQILKDVRVDNTSDRASYEFGSADRAEQYYGPLHWHGAWDALVKKLGRRSSS